MKVTLHLNGSAAAICAFLATVPASLAGGNDEGISPAPAPGAFPMPNLQVAQDDDDDNGPANMAAPATDSTGLPWDARIHANTKGTNEDGTWRKKRKVDAALVAAVENELRGGAGQLAPAPVPAPVPMPMAVAMGGPIPMPAVVAEMAAPPALTAQPAPLPVPTVMPAPMPAMQPAPIPAPVAAPAPAAEGIDFTGFMSHLTSKMQTGVVTSDDLVSLVTQINAAFTPHGHAALGAITDLQTDPQKLTYAVQLLQLNGKW